MGETRGRLGPPLQRGDLSTVVPRSGEALRLLLGGGTKEGGKAGATNAAVLVRDVLDKLHRRHAQHGRRRRVWKERPRFAVLATREEGGVEISSNHKLSRTSQIDATATAEEDLLVEAHVRATSVDKAERMAISVDVGSNMHDNYRIALEGTHGNEVDGHSIHTTLSLDRAGVGWGVATSHNVSHGSTVFSRVFSGVGQAAQLVLQSVHRVTPQDSISPLCAASWGEAVQGGLSWTRSLSPGVLAPVSPPGGGDGGAGAAGGGAGRGGAVGDKGDQLSVSCFASGRGDRSLSLRLRLGEVDDIPPLKSHRPLMT